VADFIGTERFTILKCLGYGGFGKVFEAFDHERQHKVALKVPHESKAHTIYLFKQEFRALADVTHPNLVNLFELLTHGPHWFFTMELVEGSHFYRRLRTEAPGRREQETLLDTPGLDPTRRTPSSCPEDPSLFSDASESARWVAHEGLFGVEWQSPGPAEVPISRHPAPPADYQEVRNLFRQLAEGLGALHQAGKLHRDIKPTNVLVTREGRVVLVDFGLAMDVASGPVQPSGNGKGWLTGTPVYMAPEQIMGKAPSEASDWYSVGVMLHRTLTGLYPFPDTDLSAIMDKTFLDPTSPASLVPGTPADLADLCLDLLSRDPEDRPTGREILRRLGGPALAAGKPWAHPPADALPIGRGEALADLAQAFQASRSGRSVMVVAQGRSGMGKSFLVRHFLRQIQREQAGAVVLAGRCFEQESVPYKAMDSLMDALTQHLLGLAKEDLAALLPADTAYLARLFPVLRQVEAIEPGPRPAECPDPQEFRRRAFAALRQLLAALGAQAPLVLFIDDLQWGDRDSFALLESLLRPPRAPSLLLLVAHRAEDVTVTPEIRAFWKGLSQAAVEVRELNLEELSEPAARKLAQAMLGPGFRDSEARGAWIARESEGNPYFIAELSQQALWERDFPGGPERARGGPQTLDQFIRSRVAGLDDESRQVLEALALTAHPVDWEILAQACGLDQPRPELLTGLRAAHFVRAMGQARNLVEIFHDRIREAVAKDIPGPRARETHHRLARSMERSAPTDPQALAFHFQHAGEMAQAATYAELAAEQAAKALAFEQAARYFRMVLDFRPRQLEGRVELLAKLGDALAHAGLGTEAARAYQEAALAADGHEAIRFQCKTAEQLFRCGRFDQGIAILGTVLATLGMRIPSSPWRALVGSLLRRAMIRIRGLGSSLRSESEIPMGKLDRIDICWVGAYGLGPIDHIRGGAFQARQLWLSLRAGEPYRLVRALALESIYVAHRGSRSQAATRRMLAATLALAEQVGAPGPRSRATIAAGTAALMQGRWKAGMELHEKAEALLRENCTGMDYELHISQHHALVCHWILGNLRVVETRLPACLQAAREKTDLLMTTNLMTSVAPYLHLAQGHPDRAREDIRLAMAHWSSTGFHIQHYNALVARVNIHLYEGEPEPAWELITSHWRPFRNSLLLRVQSMFITMLELRARTALALAGTLRPGSRDRKTCLKSAAADVGALRREKTPYGDALALKLQAQASLVAARWPEAAELCRKAETAFGATDMGVHAMAVRHVRSRLEGPSGSGRMAEAEQWLRDQGVVQPERFVSMHVAPCLRSEP
jgi:serine/threonine protein kinase/tetratricopeptide (TPR) repeat protein